MRTAFHLYVPGSAVDVARRFCQDMQIAVSELWAYTPIGDQFRFALIHKVPSPADARADAKEAREKVSASAVVAKGGAKKVATLPNAAVDAKAKASPQKPAPTSVKAASPKVVVQKAVAPKAVARPQVRKPAKAAPKTAKPSGKLAGKPVARGAKRK